MNLSELCTNRLILNSWASVLWEKSTLAAGAVRIAGTVWSATVLIGRFSVSRAETVLSPNTLRFLKPTLCLSPKICSNEKAVFTEPLSAALEILEQVKILPSDRVLVIGDGKLGLLVSMVLNLTGCDTLLVGKHPGKLDLFEAYGRKGDHR